MTAPYCFRRRLKASDVADVRRLVGATGFFSPQEEDIAEELVLERLQQGPASGYHFVFANAAGTLAGYTCYGPSDDAPGMFDLYWIVVSPDRQGQGMGRQLLVWSEELATSQGGCILRVETSSRELYSRTRSFYELAGYCETAREKNFYGLADDKVVYEKILSGQPIACSTTKPAQRLFPFKR